jgi:hypothetical protein
MIPPMQTIKTIDTCIYPEYFNRVFQNPYHGNSIWILAENSMEIQFLY